MSIFTSLFLLSLSFSCLFANDIINNFFAKDRNQLLDSNSAVIEQYQRLCDIIIQMKETLSKESASSLNISRLDYIQSQSALTNLIKQKESFESLLEQQILKEEAKKQAQEKAKKNLKPNDTNFIDRNLQIIDEEDTPPAPIDEVGYFEKVGMACTDGFVKAIPPTFCYKKNYDDGKLANCSPGFDRLVVIFLDRCVPQCRPGFARGEIFKSTCFETCPSGYENHPLSCYRNIFRWYFKSSYYLGETYDLYDSRATCDWGFYKDGKQCYKDCGLKGLLNCRTDICAISNQACTDGIKSLVKDFFVGLGKIFLNVITFGISGIVISLVNRNQMTDAVNKAGKQAMLTAWNNVKTWIQRVSKTNIVAEMVNYSKSVLKPSDLQIIPEGEIEKSCGTVYEIFNESIGKTEEPSFEWKNFKFSFVEEAIVKCKDAGSSFMCRKKATEAANRWDGSGLWTFASAFNQEKCLV